MFGCDSDRPIMLQMRSGPSDRTSDLLFKVGSILNRWIAWWMESGLSDRAQESFQPTMNVNHRIWIGMNMDHWITWRDFHPPWATLVDCIMFPMDRAINSVDQAIGPPCTEGNIFLFFKYYGSIFALIFILKIRKKYTLNFLLF